MNPIWNYNDIIEIECVGSKLQQIDIDIKDYDGPTNIPGHLGTVSQNVAGLTVCPGATCSATYTNSLAVLGGVGAPTGSFTFEIWRNS